MDVVAFTVFAYLEHAQAITARVNNMLPSVFL